MNSWSELVNWCSSHTVVLGWAFLHETPVADGDLGASFTNACRDSTASISLLIMRRALVSPLDIPALFTVGMVSALAVYREYINEALPTVSPLYGIATQIRAFWGGAVSTLHQPHALQLLALWASNLHSPTMLELETNVKDSECHVPC